nr:ABC transporter substrate-binding protein [uncultured Rhodopila sp.]
MPIGRRGIVAGCVLVPGVLLLAAVPVRAEDADLGRAAQFIRDSGNRLAALARGNPAPEEKQRRLLAFLEDVVDVDGVARFCLGRFWRAATPGQQADYLRLFRLVLVNSVSPRIKDYPEGGMQVTIDPPARNGAVIEVPTVVARTTDSEAPLRVIWVVGTDTGRLRIVDIVAEGMSLRLTQRSDYSAFLGRNDGNVDTLLHALRQQTGGG